MISFSGEERDARIASYINNEGTIDLWQILVDWVTVAMQAGRAEEEAQALLKDLWERTEIGSTQ